MRLIELRMLVPHMPPSSKGIGMLTKKPQILLFWANFAQIWTFLGDFFHHRKGRPKVMGVGVITLIHISNGLGVLTK